MFACVLWLVTGLVILLVRQYGQSERRETKQ